MPERLTTEAMQQIVDSLPALDDHSLQHLMGNVALTLIKRHGGAAMRSYVPGIICVCYAAGRSADVLDVVWKDWKLEIKTVVEGDHAE